MKDLINVPVEELEFINNIDWKILTIINRGRNLANPYIVVFERPDGAIDMYSKLSLDIFNGLVRRKVKTFIHKRWVNVYPSGGCHLSSSKEEADRQANSNRIACVEIVIQGKEGDGL